MIQIDFLQNDPFDMRITIYMFSCFIFNFIETSILLLFILILHRELRKMSVDQGGMSFRAAPILTKDPYPTRCTAPAPLTGTYVQPYLKDQFFRFIFSPLF
jgi:hypothetical protein